MSKKPKKTLSRSDLTSSSGTIQLVNAARAAELLSLSPRKVWELTNRGDLRCVRIGRAVRYDVADLVAWVEQRKARR